MGFGVTKPSSNGAGNAHSLEGCDYASLPR
jgi:hypothetical protein